MKWPKTLRESQKHHLSRKFAVLENVHSEMMLQHRGPEAWTGEGRSVVTAVTASRSGRGVRGVLAVGQPGASSLV